MASIFSCFRKEERPPKGPFFFISISVLLVFLITLLFPGRMEAMEVYSLRNGLNYILEERKNTGVIAIQVWVNVGSSDEKESIAGVTHFIEHLIFKGTEKLKGNAFASQIEAMGGSVNAFTSFDNTVYHITIPAKVFREGFELLVESVKNPAFPEDEITKERKVILEEIKMGEDDPQRKLFKEMFALSYQGKLYERPIIGFSDTVEKISRQDIVDYFRSHYIPQNMAVVIAGDFDKKEALALIDKHFSGLKAGKAPARQITNNAAAKETQKILEKDVRENYLALAYPAPKRTDPDVPVLDVLGVILGDSESSRLQETLKKKKGLVNGISTYVFTPKEDGLFIVYANYSGNDTEKVISGIDKELAAVKEKNIRDWELTKAKNMLKAYYIYDAETVQGRARQIGDSKTVTDDPHFIEKYLKAVDAVTKEDVKRAACKYLEARDRRIVIMKPKRSNPFKHTFENGLTCLVNKNASSPSFAFKMGFIGGSKKEAEGTVGEFNLLSRMLLRGTKKKSSSQIAKETDLLAGSLSPFNGRNLFGLSGKFLSKDLKEVMSLLKEILMETDMKDEELRRVKREILSEIRQRDDDPVGQTFMRFNEEIFAGHPYSRDTMGKEEDVERMSLQEIAKAYKRYVTPRGAVLAISGDVDEKEIFALVGELLRGWKGEKTDLLKVYPKAARKDVDLEKDIQQTHIVFGFLGPGLTDKDRYAAEVLDAVLSGMGGRIHQVLREENPYAYALTFFNQMAYETGAMGIYIGTSEKFVKDVIRIAGEEIERIREKGFTDKEVEDGKRYLIGNHYIKIQSNGSISSAMCFDTLYGLPPGSFKTWPSHIEKVTKADVDRVARKYLTPETMVRFLVGKVKNNNQLKKE